MKYKPQTEFYTTEDSSLVFNLKQDGWNQGKPRMIKDVWITIQAPAEHRREIANLVMNGLNQHYKLLPQKTKEVLFAEKLAAYARRRGFTNIFEASNFNDMIKEYTESIKNEV